MERGRAGKGEGGARTRRPPPPSAPSLARGGIPPNTLARLQSAERALGSQSLDTPAGPSAAAVASPAPPPRPPLPHPLPPAVDGFTISYSQSYARAPGHPCAACSPGGGPPARGASAPPSATPRGARATPPARGDSTPLPDRPPTPCDCVPSTSAAVRCATPELAPDADGARAGGGRVSPGGRAAARDAPLFPIFRPLHQRKTVHILRHGESAYNAAVSAAGSGFADPLIFDARLTPRGRAQATRASATLAALRLPADALWVVSPLTRALETFSLASRAGGAGAGPSSAPPQPHTVTVRADLAEHCATAGDVGAPASALRAAWPALAAAGAFDGLPERWWHGAHVNCAAKRTLAAYETKRELAARVGAFRRWLHTVDARVVVCVGHSTHFAALAGGRARLRNCEVHTLYV